jgi:hypothetical protein
MRTTRRLTGCSHNENIQPSAQRGSERSNKHEHLRPRRIVTDACNQF